MCNKIASKVTLDIIFILDSQRGKWHAQSLKGKMLQAQCGSGTFPCTWHQLDPGHLGHLSAESWERRPVVPRPEGTALREVHTKKGRAQI